MNSLVAVIRVLNQVAQVAQAAKVAKAAKVAGAWGAMVRPERTRARRLDLADWTQAPDWRRVVWQRPPAAVSSWKPPHAEILPARATKAVLFLG